MEENFNSVAPSTQPPFVAGPKDDGRPERSGWIFVDGEVHLQYGQDILAALQEVIASPAFQDHTIINNAPIFLLPRVALDLGEGLNNLILGGGLLYGAQYAVGGTLLRMGWSIELTLTGLRKPLYLFARISRQERQAKMDSTSVRFWGIETADITKGPISVAFAR